MADNDPPWLKKKLEKQSPQSTRARSDKQETRVAKDFGGRKTINSGATFRQNDVQTKVYEIEAKTTAKKSFTFNLETWHKLHERTPLGKIPLIVLDFETEEEAFVIVKYSDFLSEKITP